MASFRFTESAEQDVAAILSYTMATWGEAQAQIYIGGLYDVLALLSDKPGVGRIRPDLAPGLRSFPYREHLVFYALFEDAIMVIRVLAARRNITGHLFGR
jgi:toxin ParE1/3/4